ncbi:hypothetical protein BBJ28_00011969 [Nothophytophthora sp. Chile5]|nr:hypothetical protein BBJ28_00011969 [Nothophytophthora sp. Chile5]
MATFATASAGSSGSARGGGSLGATVVNASDPNIGSGSSNALAVAASNVTAVEPEQPTPNSGAAGSVSTGETSDSGSVAMSTPMLIAVIAGSAIVLAAILFLIRAKRRRYKPKTLTPSHCSAFQGVTSTTALGHTTGFLGASTASTAMTSPVATSPQSLEMQTIKIPRLTALNAAEERRANEINSHEVVRETLPPERGTQISRATSMASSRSVFSASLFMRGGLRSSLPSLAAFRASRADRSSQASTLQSRRPTASTISFANTVSTISYPNATITTVSPAEQRGTDGAAWRDLSDTCWSIGPDESDSENESVTAPVGAISQGKTVLPTRNRLSTLSDDVGDLEELSDGRERGISELDDSSRRREREISSLDDSSPRRVRGLSALGDSRTANSHAELNTNESGASYFSNDSEFYDETIKDCSSVLFDDSDSDSDDDDESPREEEF